MGGIALSPHKAPLMASVHCGGGVASRYEEAVQNDLGAGVSSFLSVPNQGPLQGLPQSILLMPE